MLYWGVRNDGIVKAMEDSLRGIDKELYVGRRMVLRDVLAEFAVRGHLGGRIAAGHGQVAATVTATALRGRMPDENTDWSAELAASRQEAIAALHQLS